MVASPDGIHGPVAGLLDRLDEDVALLSLSHVVFKSGYLYDMETLTAAAHAAGALVLWDLSHAAGAVPIDLSGARRGPRRRLHLQVPQRWARSPGIPLRARDLQAGLDSPISGWWGHTRPFDFELGYAPDPGIRRFLTGTAPVVSMALIEPGVEMLNAAGMTALRTKSVAQTEYLIARWEADLAPLGFTLNSPRDADVRGSHVSLGHPAGLGIDLALINDHGVLPDFRPPDNLRLGVAPLYTRFADIATAVDAMVDIVTTGRHRHYLTSRPAVT